MYFLHFFFCIFLKHICGIHLCASSCLPAAEHREKTTKSCNKLLVVEYAPSPVWKTTFVSFCGNIWINNLISFARIAAYSQFLYATSTATATTTNYAVQNQLFLRTVTYELLKLLLLLLLAAATVVFAVCMKPTLSWFIINSHTQTHTHTHLDKQPRINKCMSAWMKDWMSEPQKSTEQIKSTRYIYAILNNCSCLKIHTQMYVLAIFASVWIFFCCDSKYGTANN